MLLNEQMFDSVCAKLGIKTQVGHGEMYIEENGSCRRLTDDDFEDAFGFLNDSSETVCDSISYKQNKTRIVNDLKPYDDTDSAQLLYAS